MPRILLPLAAVLAIAVPGEPQQPAPPTPVFGADVEMVAVDVAVVDDTGRPVRGLTPADFQVRVDGKPRRVMSADFFALGEEAEPAPPAVPHSYSTNEGTRGGRAVILAFDIGSIPSGSGLGAVKAADELLDRLSPSDRVALVTIPARGGPQVDLTSDHNAVREALGRVVGRGRIGDPRRRLSITEALALEDESFEWQQALARECPENSMSGNEYLMCVASIRDEASTVTWSVRQQGQDSVGGLRALFRSLARIEGRKTVVLVTVGLVSESSLSMADLGKEAGAAGATLYVLRIVGSGEDSSTDRPARDALRDEFALGSGLDSLAAATNGTTFRLVGHGDLIFDRIARELSGYYLLGFEPQEGDRDGKVHDIQARVTRPGATVRARKALSIPTATLDAQRQKDLLASALQSPVPAVELPVRVATWTLPGEGGKVRLMIGADVGAPGTSAAGLTVGWVLLSGKGKVVSSAAQRADAEAAAAPGVRGVPFFSSTSVDPALYTLKLAAVDSRGRRGTVEHPVSAALTTGAGVSASDLLLSPPAAKAGAVLKPVLDVDASRGVIGVVEVDAPAGVEIEAVAEVASRETGPTLLSMPALAGPPANGRRVFQAAVGTHLLPAGDYVMRMVVRAARKPALSVSRPFHLDAVVQAKDAPVIGADDVRSLLRFRRADVVGPDVSQALVTSAPGPAAAALREGLDHLARNALPQAMRSFREASRAAPGSGAGVFFTGVTLAADGRDRDAIGAWQVARTRGLPSSAAQAALADALLRVGDIAAAEDVLREGLAKWPADPRLERSQAVAAAMAGRRDAARALLTRAVERDPADVELRFVLVRLLLEEARTNGPAGTREELTQQAAAYVDAKGANAELVMAWLRALEEGR